MKIAPINFEVSQSGKNSVNKNKSNPNFGVKLMLGEDIPSFVIKESANQAIRNGIDPNLFIKEQLTKLVSFGSKLLEKVKDIEPKNLPLLMSLTPKATAYTADRRANGIGFGSEDHSILLQGPRMFGIGHAEERFKNFSPCEKSFQEIENAVRSMAKIHENFYR